MYVRVYVRLETAARGAAAVAHRRHSPSPSVIRTPQLKPIQASPPSLQRVPLHRQFISERGLFIMRVLIVLAALSISLASGNYFTAHYLTL